jgi:YfiH family protein
MTQASMIESGTTGPAGRPAPLTASVLDGLPGVRHAFFTRTGGVSEGLYAGLNCGSGSNDDPDRVAKNRARAMAHMGLGEDRLVAAYQVHSNRVAVVERPWRRADAPKVDAMVTRQPGIALGILTADCVPVLLADAEAGVIGAAHAGWRGALDGVVGAVVAAMTGLGARAERIAAAIGPAIGAKSYEVGPEFPAPFLAQAPDNADFFTAAPREGHFLFDIQGYVARRIAAAGVTRVETLARDTCAEEALFFSYRRSCQRGEPDYGRDLSAIALGT